MKDYLLSLRDSAIYLAIGLALACLIFVGIRLAQAQQPPVPMPPPTCQGELATAKQYNNILLNNTTNYETQAREFWGQVQELRQKLDAAEAKLKALEPQTEATAQEKK